ncbi:ERCC4 domain-containing protein [Neobittarella massiliensis]|uniref:ERCC4 domain-containing protein n=2 Tax=Neobittarella massiliensis (ex Bilen et al. 2018) TaxID=2041842 RepID=A0A8J6IM57_9FIRM|nr:ERCC4 domain-containing protein [Neobittarella massiliensis]
MIMRRRYSEKEIKDRLKRLEILADTREQVWEHVESALAGQKIAVQRGKLDFGDYTALIPDGTGGFYSLQDEVVIERKANIDEIAGNFTADRRRFEAEFLRARASGVKVFLLIENATWQDIFDHRYRSQLSPKALAASLLSWQAKYGITVVFCRPQESGRILYGILYYWARQRLEGGFT